MADRSCVGAFFRALEEHAYQLAMGRIIELTSSYFVDDWQTAITIITIFTRTGAGVGRYRAITRVPIKWPLSESLSCGSKRRWVNGIFSNSIFRYFFYRDCVARAEPRERLEKIYCPIKNLFTIVLDRRRAYPNRERTTKISTLRRNPITR